MRTNKGKVLRSCWQRLVCPLTYKQSGKVVSTRNQLDPTGITCSIIEVHKPPHHDKVAALGGGRESAQRFRGRRQVVKVEGRCEEG